MIHGVIFDLGSTLMWWEADAQTLDARQCGAMLRFLKENAVPAGEDLLPFFHAARAEGWRLAEETESEHTVEEALTKALARIGCTPHDGLPTRAVASFFAEGEQYWRPYPESIATLEALRSRGLRIGIISNADDDALVHRAAERLAFTPYVHPVLSSAGGQKWRKPDPRIFHLVTTEWGLPPSQVVMVGDAPKYDILGAHRAGMRGILIDRNEGHTWQQVPQELVQEPMIQPDAVVHSLLQIPDVIAGW